MIRRLIILLLIVGWGYCCWWITEKIFEDSNDKNYNLLQFSGWQFGFTATLFSIGFMIILAIIDFIG